MDSYEYEPLDTDADYFRLLTLLPGEFHDPITFSIEHVPFPFQIVRVSIG